MFFFSNSEFCFTNSNIKSFQVAVLGPPGLDAASPVMVAAGSARGDALIQMTSLHVGNAESKPPKQKLAMIHHAARPLDSFTDFY